MTESTSLEAKPLIVADSQFLSDLHEVCNNLEAKDPASIIPTLSINVERYFNLLIRSFLLCSARQDWNSNSPYMRNKRITPGIVFLWNGIFRISLQISTNRYQIYFVSMLWKRIVEFLIKFYLGISLSRARLQQFKFDLSFVVISSLHLVSKLLSYNFTDFENSSNNTILTQLQEIVESNRIIVFLLAVLDEQDVERVISLYEELEGLLERASTTSNTLSDLKRQCENIFESWDLLKSSSPSNIIFGKDNFVFGSYCFGLEKSPTRRNELLQRRTALVEGLEQSNFPLLHSRLGLPAKDLFSKCIQTDPGFAWFHLVLQKRKEMMEGSFPPLNDQDIERREKLKNAFEKYKNP